jgi:hypothetical protein
MQRANFSTIFRLLFTFCRVFPSFALHCRDSAARRTAAALGCGILHLTKLKASTAPQQERQWTSYRNTLLTRSLFSMKS